MTIGDIAAWVTAVAAVAAVVVTLLTRKQVTDLHVQINSRMDDWLKDAKAASRAEGKEAGVKEEAKKPK